MTFDVTRGAAISETGTYRYWLTRSWSNAVPATFIMLNPSTADAFKDDRTIVRCVDFARAWGYGGIRVVNLYAYRATDPHELSQALDPIGPENDRHLRFAARLARLCHAPLIAAWGCHAQPSRVEEVMSFPNMNRLVALGITKDGHPRHPLYLHHDSKLQPWKPR
jgi:hypothetical protein